MAAPVVHFEIQAADPDRALAFYAAVFGWTHNAAPDMEQAYWLVFPSGEEPAEAAGRAPETGIGGGMLVRPGPGPEEGAAVNAFVCVLQVEDLDAAHAAVTEHGGTIAVPPFPVAGVGRVFYCKDTEGNLLGVMEPETPPT